MARRLRLGQRRKLALLHRSRKFRRDLYGVRLHGVDFLAWILWMYTPKDLTKFTSECINLFVNLEKCREQ